MSAPLDALRRRYEGYEPQLMGKRNEFAVLCPFVELSDGPHLLFEVRAAKLRQGGEVCFPGGRMEADESPAECALRETEEELSIPRREISLFGASDFICHQRGFLLRPILGIVSPAGLAALRPSPAEVSETFMVPLAFFQNHPPEVYNYTLLPQVPANFPYESIGIDRNYSWGNGHADVPVWYWQGHAIWGLTARIVQDILTK